MGEDNVPRGVEHHEVQRHIRNQVGKLAVDILPENLHGSPKPSTAIGAAAAAELFDLFGHDTSPDNIRRLMAAAAELTIGRVFSSPSLTLRLPGGVAVTYNQPQNIVKATAEAGRLEAQRQSQVPANDLDYDPL